MEVFPSELNSENLEEFLAEDSAFVDYFNTFLSLPCFPERIFYNKELDLLEQFSQKLMKDENDNVQISSRPPPQQERTKHDLSYNTVHINYCVTVLDRRQGFEWVKKYRLPEFLKSELYAEFKLSKILSAAQALYIKSIKNDISRAKSCALKTQRGLPSASKFSQVSGFHRSQAKSFNSEPSDSDVVSNCDTEPIYCHSDSSVQKESTIDNLHNTTGRPSNVEEVLNDCINENSDKNVKEITRNKAAKPDKILRNDDFETVKGRKNQLYFNNKLINYKSKQCFHNAKNFATSDASEIKGQTIALGHTSATVPCEKDDIFVGKEFENVNDKTSQSTQAEHKETGRSKVLTRTFDSRKDVFTTSIDKQNDSALKPRFRISSVDQDPSEEILPDRSADLNKGKSKKISQDVTKKPVDLTNCCSLCPSVTESDATGSDVTAENSMNNCFVGSDVVDSDVIGNVTIKSDIEDSNVIGNGTIKSDIEDGDVISSDVMRSDLTCGGISNDVQSRHKRNEIDNDSSGRDRHDDYYLKTPDNPTENVTLREEVCTLVNGDLRMTAKTAKSGGLDKNYWIFRDTDESTNHCNVDIVIDCKDNSSETVSDRVSTRTTKTPNRNMVLNNERLLTLQEVHEARTESDSNHENVQCCKCHREDNDMSKDEEVKAVTGFGEDDTLVEDQSGSPRRYIDGVKDSEVNYECIKLDEILNENRDNWNLYKERRGIEDPEKEPKTSLSHMELLNRERGRILNCENINGTNLFTGNDTNAKHHEIAGIHLDCKSSGMLSKHKENSNRSKSLDMRVSDFDGVLLNTNDDVITECESGEGTSEDSPRKLESLQNFFNSNKVSVEKDERSLGHEEEGKDSQVDLSTKQGMDKLKEFLTNTKGETLLLCWLQVELWKHRKSEEEKREIIEELKEKFLKNGSPLELPSRIKRHLKLYIDDLSEAQRTVAQPLHTYWCPRFTLHQLNNRSYNALKHQENHSNASHLTVRKAWTDIVPNCNIPRLPHFIANSRIKRPHSTTPQLTQAKERKHYERSKSAHSRIISTPYHTNAGEQQLELYATPPSVQYGFQKRPIVVFPPPNDPDYLSPVRLVINPLTKPRLRTAWSQSSEGNSHSSQVQSGKSQKNLFSESLVEALTYRTETGCFFEEFVKKQNNKLWLNCHSLWQALIEYCAYFDGDGLNPVQINRKAQWIYTRYIAPGSICDVQLGWKKEAEVRRQLQPPYEELFDVVEEHVLACLKEPWDSLCHKERREYDMVPKEETIRYLQVNLKQANDRRKSLGFIEELESHDEEEKDFGKFSIEEANHPLPVPKDGVTFETIIKDRAELEGFQKFLEKRDPKGVTDLMAWTDMETFQRIPRTMEDKRNKKAKEIRDGYLNSKFFFGPSSPATKEAQNLIISMNGSSRIKELPSASIISECQKYVRCRIERRWLALYKQSLEYKERQNPKQNLSEVVEDIMLRRRLQRSEAAWRVLNSRWVSSSRDIVALRQTLNNPQSCLAFRKFVALKGETYENDVLFWVEVQKYKDLCHRHASENCIKKKVHAITDCFITSSIPPELQIDVPIEMAEKLMERITSRNPTIGPYLFREVQMTVFRVLFNMWKEFCTFRGTIKDESLLEVLEKKLQQHRVEVRQKREASERRKLAKQEAEKKRKEKEDKERKELKSMEQLVSLMNESSSWEHEEEDVVLWRYSKHLIGNELYPSVKKTSTQEETSSFMELAYQRSRATKSTNNITNSVKSERNTGKDHSAVSNYLKLVKDGSVVTESVHSNQTKRSHVTKKSMNLSIPKMKQPGRNRSSNDKKRANSPRKDKTGGSKSKKDNRSERTTLLKNRRRNEPKKVSDRGMPNLVLDECQEKSAKIEDTSGEESRIECLTVDDSRCKTRGIKDSRTVQPTKRSSSTTGSPKGIHHSDITSVDSEGPGNLKMSVLRRQRQDSRGRNISPVTLTSELLKDFTNSPEGAPLEIPLPLIKISESQNVDRNHTSHSFRRETKQQIFTQERNKTERSTSRYRLEKARKQIQDFIPDVIVN